MGRKRVDIPIQNPFLQKKKGKTKPTNQKTPPPPPKPNPTKPNHFFLYLSCDDETTVLLSTIITGLLQTWVNSILKICLCESGVAAL